ncbi:DNA polymerase II, partial [bacterium]|nr:DNA polymerase II [bacterium]
MTAGQKEAMEVAESAREKEWRKPSFASKLFMGDFDYDLVKSFPAQDAEDKKLGDEFLKKVEEFLVNNLDPEEVDRTNEIPKSVIDGLFELGLFGMKVPKEYEGLGFSQINYNRVATLVASYCGSTATLISAHQSIGVPNPLKMVGTEEQKKQFFPRLAKRSISAFALTEPGVGSDPAKMSTMATPTEDGQHYLINGEKLWCTNGPLADLMVVMTRTPPKIVRGKEKQQITAFIVERDTPGIEMSHRCEFMGLGGIYNCLFKFKDVKVPKENILWAEGRGLALALRTLNAGRLTLPAACTGLGKYCIAVNRRWGKDRVQWGKSIADHEAGAQKVAFISSMTFACEAISLLTSAWTDKGEMDLRIEAAMAKLFCTEAAWKMIDETMQFRGGRGYETARSLKARGEEGYAIERAMRDSRINLILEGSSEIMKLFLAREAMDPHLRLAGDLINPRTSIGTKLSTAAKLAGFYGT